MCIFKSGFVIFVDHWSECNEDHTGELLPLTCMMDF